MGFESLYVYLEFSGDALKYLKLLLLQVNVKFDLFDTIKVQLIKLVLLRILLLRFFGILNAIYIELCDLFRQLLQLVCQAIINLFRGHLDLEIRIVGPVRILVQRI